MRQSLFAKLVLPAALLLCALYSGQNAYSEDSGDAGEIAAIRELLASTQPNMVVADVVLSASGLYEVTVESGQTLYVTRDARFLIPGDLYEARAEGLVNLGEMRRNVRRRELIAELDEADMIVFEPQGERKATITVFTDVDCPYCRKLHAEIEQLNGYGIAIRYLAFPRTGLDTETAAKMESTWCAEDRQATFTSATRGGDVALAECENPVASQYELGREVGVTGTPALVFEDGNIMPGYVPADQLAQYLFGEAP
jgi:thiol:disulfide interchange protein DsbC